MIKPRPPPLELAGGWKHACITRYRGDPEGQIHLDRATPRCRSTVMAITGSDLVRVQWDERLAFVVVEYHRTLFEET